MKWCKSILVRVKVVNSSFLPWSLVFVLVLRYFGAEAWLSRAVSSVESESVPRNSRRADLPYCLELAWGKIAKYFVVVGVSASSSRLWTMGWS